MVKTSAFTSLFGRSPFKPMQEHIGVAARCAAEVPKLFEALAAGDQEKVVAVKDRIYELEQEADEIKNELRAHLPKSLLLPVDRRDLLEVLDMQDSIADTAQDIAGLLFERPMEVPENLKDPLLALTRFEHVRQRGERIAHHGHQVHRMPPGIAFLAALRGSQVHEHTGQHRAGVFPADMR